MTTDAAVADPWEQLQAQAPGPVPAVDSLLAATAQHHGLRLVIRNVRDLTFPGLGVIDPWKG